MLVPFVAAVIIAQAAPKAAPAKGDYIGARVALPKVQKGPAVDGTLNDPSGKATRPRSISAGTCAISSRRSNPRPHMC